MYHKYLLRVCIVNLLLQIHFSSFSKEKFYHTISLKESTLNGLIDVEAPHHIDLINLTQRHVVRVYRYKMRQNSYNLNLLIYCVYDK